MRSNGRRRPKKERPLEIIDGFDGSRMLKLALWVLGLGMLLRACGVIVPDQPSTAVLMEVEQSDNPASEPE